VIVVLAMTEITKQGSGTLHAAAVIVVLAMTVSHSVI